MTNRANVAKELLCLSFCVRQPESGLYHITSTDVPSLQLVNEERESVEKALIETIPDAVMRHFKRQSAVIVGGPKIKPGGSAYEEHLEFHVAVDSA